MTLASCGNQSEVDAEAQTWQEAYTVVLMQYNEYMYAADLHPEEGWRFTLFDIDGDGQPELIVWESTIGTLWFGVRSAYTFIDGVAQSLEITEDFGGRPASTFVFTPPNSGNGMIINSGGEGFSRHMLVIKQDGKLIIDVCLTVSIAPWFYGYDFALHYVRGIDAVSAELPDLPYQIVKDHAEMLMRGYVLVTEQDFDWIRYDVFGDMPKSDHTPIHNISESNIREVMNIFS